MPSKLIKANCSFCNKEFQRGKYDIERTLKKSGNVYCSIKCSKAYLIEISSIKNYSETKICTKCKEEKLRDAINFPLHNKTLDGLDSWCRKCRATYRNEICRGLFRDSISDENLKKLKLQNQLEKKFQQIEEQIKKIEEALLKIEPTVDQSFVSFFDGNEPVGKSLLQKEVIKVYVKKLLKNDIQFITKLSTQNQVLSILKLEEEFSAPLTIKINGEDTTVFIKGKIDRIDSYNNMIRVIDYKSSVKDSDQFVFSDFENLFNDKNYNK